MSRSDLLLAWYDKHRRALPWRALPGAVPDPYAVWLSEVMLQQTTVAAVKAYYLRFLALWPNVTDLAAAPAEAIMREWAGLGYYSRARNLHAAAKAVAADHGGRFPASEEGLRALPGVGAYTAAAIAAIAFGQRAVVVDGNVERVVSRLFAIDTPLPAAKSEIRARMDELTPDRRAGDFAQAMMDLGATICTPKRPACALCPLDADCAARRAGNPETFPVKPAKKTRPERIGLAYLARRADGMVLVRTRPDKGLLGGMVELPGSDWVNPPQTPAEAAPFPGAWRPLPGTVRHVFTHFGLTLRLLRLDPPASTPAPEGHRWVDEKHLARAGLPTVMRKAAMHGLGGEAKPGHERR